MKRIGFRLGIMILATLVVTGCGGAQQVPEAQELPKAQPLLPVGQVITIEDVKFVVSPWEEERYLNWSVSAGGPGSNLGTMYTSTYRFYTFPQDPIHLETTFQYFADGKPDHQDRFDIRIRITGLREGGTNGSFTRYFYVEAELLEVIQGEPLLQRRWDPNESHTLIQDLRELQNFLNQHYSWQDDKEEARAYQYLRESLRQLQEGYKLSDYDFRFVIESLLRDVLHPDDASWAAGNYFIEERNPGNTLKWELLVDPEASENTIRQLKFLYPRWITRVEVLTIPWGEEMGVNLAFDRFLAVQDFLGNWYVIIPR